MAIPLQHAIGALPDLALIPGLGPAGLTLRRGRTHEICGPARRVLAVLALASAEGPVLWVQPGWIADRLCPAGVNDYADPGRLLFALARRPEDLLWTMEEGLRSGAAPVVVADLPAPPALTPMRRLQLAAEAGAEAARPHRRPPPLGLVLTPGEGGAAGAESRWHMAPAPAPAPRLDQARAPRLWRLERRRARTLPPAAWVVTEAPEGGFGAEPRGEAIA